MASTAESSPVRVLLWLTLLLLVGCQSATPLPTQIPADEVIDRWLKDMNPLPSGDAEPEPVADLHPTQVPITVNARGVRLDILLQSVALALSHNLILQGQANSIVTMDVRNVGVDELLDGLRMLSGMDIELTEGSTLVASSTPLQRQKLQRTQLLRLRHLSADRLIPGLSAANPKVSLSPAADHQAIWALGSPQHIAQLKKHIRLLDKPRQQIFIEVFIVELNRSELDRYGITLGGEDGSGNRVRGGLGDSEDANLLLNLGFLEAGVGLVVHNAAKSLRVQLQALQSRGWSKILSNPRVFVLNGERAEIFEGSEVPYTTTSDRGTQTEFREAGLKLEVTPRILSQGRISLQLKINKDTVDASTSNPTIIKRQLSTKVEVESGATLALGGIFSRELDGSNSQVPGVSRIPLLRALFSRRSKGLRTSELLVFVQPRVL